MGLFTGCFKLIGHQKTQAMTFGQSITNHQSIIKCHPLTSSKDDNHEEPCPSILLLRSQYLTHIGQSTRHFQVDHHHFNRPQHHSVGKVFC
jgi:hypothetical protein